MIDTGFTSALAVPRALFSGLPGTVFRGVVVVADGRVVEVRSVFARVRWLGEEREVKVLELGERIVVGMELLEETTISLRKGRVGVTR